MNRDSTSQGNDPAARFGQPSRISWLALPNSIDASRRQLSNSSMPQVGASHFHVSVPQAPLDFSSAPAVSQTPTTAASKNSTSSNIESSQHASSRDQIFVVGPAFSLADESVSKLQTPNASQTTSSDSHQLAPVIGSVQTLSSNGTNTHTISVSGPKVVSSQGPQICIGSVFSLADSHLEHEGQHETENEASHTGIDSSASHQTKQDVPALSHVNQQDKPSSGEKVQKVVSQLLTTPHTQFSALISALSNPLSLRPTPGSSSNTYTANTELDKVNQRNSSVSLSPVPIKVDFQLVPGNGTGVPTSIATQQPTSPVTSIKDAQLSVNQKDGSIITVTEKKPTDVLRDEKKQEKSIVTKPQDSGSTSEMPRPFANVCNVQEPEVVDLDTEDIDDCLLVKIDLSRHHFSYGSKIHNSEVVIDDSDNDEDVTDLTKEAREVSSRKTVSGECDKQKSDASSTAVNKNETCGPTGSLSMEVEEIHTEASNITSNGTDESYTMSSTEETCVTSVGSRTNIQPLSEGRRSTWHTSETQHPEPELMDLHVDDDDDDDDASLSTFEYVPLKATPLQQDNNISTPFIKSIFSSSSLLGNTSNIPILKESYQNSSLEPTVQGQFTGSTPKSIEVLPRHYPSLQDFVRGQPSPVANSSKPASAVVFSRPISHNNQLNSTTEDVTNSEESSQSDTHKEAPKSDTLKRKGKATKNKTPKMKLSALTESPILKESYQNSFLGPTIQGHFAGRTNSFLGPAVQGQFAGSTNLVLLPTVQGPFAGNTNSFLGPTVQDQFTKRTEAPYLHLVEHFMRDQSAQVANSSKVIPAVGFPRPVSHNIQLNSAAEEITNSESSQSEAHKGKSLKRKGKATKSKPPKIKISALTKTQKKPSSDSHVGSDRSDSHVGSDSSAISQGSHTVPDSSLMCKLCFMSFSSRMELVTHTWSWHRGTQSEDNNPKCDGCGKRFANNSLLKLHKKVNCITCNIPTVKPGTRIVSLDSIMHNIIRQGVFLGAPKVFSASATLRDHAEPQLSSAGLSSSSAVVASRNSPHLNVSSLSNSYPRGNEGNSNISTGAASNISTGVVSNISTGVATETVTNKHPGFATGHSGEKTVYQKLIQEEDIKPVITSTGEIQEQSHVTGQVAASPSSSDSHKSATCQKLCSDGIELSLHQISGRCRVAGNDGVKCFVCAKTFTSSIFKYLHVLNNPECKEKADRYCPKCSQLFESPAEKQEHLHMFKVCQLYEDYLIKDIMKDPLVKNVEQNVKQPESQPCPTSTVGETSEPDKSTAPAQTRDSRQVTDLPAADSVSCQRCHVLLPNKNTLQQHFQMNPACKNHSERLEGEGASKQKPLMEAKPNVTCPACKKKFATSAVLILHFNASPKCRMKICSPSKVAKKISASDRTDMSKPADRINMPKPTATPKSQRKTPKGNAIKSRPAAVNTSRNVFSDISSTVRFARCKVCGAEFASKKKLAQHYDEQEICKKLENDLPFFNLRIVLRRFTVMCKVCHLPFADDIKLAEHLHLNQPCQIGTAKREKVLNKSHLDTDACKREGKKRSCQIGTGISNVTSTISAVTKDECITLAGENNINNENLTKVNDGQVSNDSSAVKMYILNKGNADDSDKGDLNSISSSDEGSGMDESASSSEEGNTDYTCTQCCKKYTSKSQLKKHNKLRHHSGQSKKAHCKVCTRKFHDVTGLQAHLLQFKFCFIPLTRPLWERKQDPHFCSMCRKVLSGPKDLRKHCFKKMGCRLRYVNKVLQNIKEKDNASVPPAAEAEIKASKAVTENYESHSANEVSSSVQDCCNPVEVDSSNSDVDVEDVTSCIKISHVVSKPLTECLNCSGLFDDFHEHLLKQQSCLDFFGIPGNTCPVPLHFCYQCKTHFNDTIHLKLHACRGFVAYTHACQTCGLKFTSAQNLHAHVQQSLTCNKASLLPPQKNNDSDRIAIGSYATIQQDGTLASSSAVKDVPSASSEQSFPCLICDARFATLRLLMEHSYQHVEETPIACDRCNITFLHYNQFVSHQAFHIRMDKEANSLLGKQPPSIFGASSSVDKNTIALHDNTVKNYISTCIFCHKEFANVKAKLAHLLNDYACLAVLKYVVESGLFIHDQKIRVADPNCCEFCSLRFSDKMYHYMSSACFGRLEAAILKYRSSPHPTECKEIDSAVSQPGSKEAGIHNIQSKRQGDQHSSVAASLSSGSSSSTGEFPEEACCLKCGRCFKTVAEVNEHQTLLGHKQILPQSVVKSANWQMHSMKCNICNVKYTQRHGLFLHMINKHSNKESHLFPVVGNTSRCSICHKKVLPAHLQFHFERHKKKFMQEIMEKSDQPLRTPSQEVCIFCNRTYLSRKYIIIHLKRHKHADIFPPQGETSSDVTNLKSPVGYKSKHVKENQMAGSACKSAASSNVIGSCSLCQKQIKSHIKYFQNHFRYGHKDHVPERWREFFVPLADLKEECSPSKAAAKGVKRRYGVKQLGCRLCHKAFVCHRGLVNHFSLSHADLAPERWEEYTEKIEPTQYKQADDFHSAQSEPLKKKNTNIKMQASGYGSAKLKSCREPKFSNVGVSRKAVKSHPTVSCKICNKQFFKLRFFKVHFHHAHKRYEMGNWEDVYSVLETAYSNSTQTETTEGFITPQSASETLKLKLASIESKNKSHDPAEFDSDMQNVSIPSASKKKGKLQPVGSCKLCHKEFTTVSVFKFHVKKYHALYTSQINQKHLFNAFVPSHVRDNFENSDSEDSAATLAALSPEKQGIIYPLKSKDLSVLNSSQILLRVCHVCQATFRDISSYQVHLRTHLKPCKINIKSNQDMHSQLRLNMPGVYKDQVDLQVKVEDDDVSLAREVVIIDDESEEECLYPDSTTSEVAKSVQTRVLDEESDSQSIATSAEYGSFLEFSTQDQLKNSADGSDFTNAERSKSISSDSSVSKSHGDIVIDTSRPGLSIGSHKNNCEARSESGSVDMFSDEENDDLPKEDTSSLVGNIVHTIVDCLFNDYSSDHSRGMSKIEVVTVSDNRPTESQPNQDKPNGTNKVCNKRKAHEAGLEQDKCSEVKRRNLTQETVCNDQTTNGPSHVLGGNSGEKNMVHEVGPDQVVKLQRSKIIQLGCSVGVEDWAISESSTISESACEVSKFGEVDFNQVQNVEHQSCDMKKVDNDQVQNVEHQSCDMRKVDNDQVQNVEHQSCDMKKVDNDQVQIVEHQSCDMRKVDNDQVQNVKHQSCDMRKVDNDQVQNVEHQSCDMRKVDSDQVQNVEHHSCDMRKVDEVDSDQVQNVEHQSCDMRKVDSDQVQNVEHQSCDMRKVDNDQVQNVEHQSCDMRKVDNDQVQNVEHQSCDMRKVDNDQVQNVKHQSCDMRKVDNDQVQNVEHQSCDMRKVDSDQVQNVEHKSCDTRKVDEVDLYPVQNQSCEMRCKTLLNTHVSKDGLVSYEADTVINKLSDGENCDKMTCSEFSQSSLLHGTFSPNKYSDTIIDELSDVAGSNCEKT